MLHDLNPLTTAILAVVAGGYLLYRLVVPRPVTGRDLFLPLSAALYLGNRYMGNADVAAVATILGGVAFGLLTGLTSGLLVSVWRSFRRASSPDSAPCSAKGYRSLAGGRADAWSLRWSNAGPPLFCDLACRLCFSDVFL